MYKSKLKLSPLFLFKKIWVNRHTWRMVFNYSLSVFACILPNPEQFSLLFYYFDIRPGVHEFRYV